MDYYNFLSLRIRLIRRQLNRSDFHYNQKKELVKKHEWKAIILRARRGK